MNGLHFDAKNSILDVEIDLRVMIDHIMIINKGTQWIENLNSGLTEDKIQTIQNTRSKETKNTDNNLLTFTYLSDLKNIIIKNWILFDFIFEKKKFEVFLDMLIKYRNSLMHARKLEDYEYYLVIGISVKLLKKINEWKNGSRSIVTKYEAEIQYPGGLSDNKVIDIIKTCKSELKPKNSDDIQTLSFDEGKVSIVAKNEGLLVVTSSNKDLLDKIVKTIDKACLKLNIFLKYCLKLDIIHDNMRVKGFESQYVPSDDHISFVAYSNTFPSRFLRFNIHHSNNPILSVEFSGKDNEGLVNIDSITNLTFFKYFELEYENRDKFIKNILKIDWKDFQPNPFISIHPFNKIY